MTKGALALVMVLALLCGYLGMRLRAVEARPAFPSPPSHPLVQLVGMTPDQSRQLEDLEREFVARRDPIRDKILATRADIFNLLQAEHPDQARIDAEIKTISALQTQIQDEVAQHLLRVKALLTQPQRKQFFAALAVTMCPAAVGSGRCPMTPQPAPTNPPGGRSGK